RNPMLRKTALFLATGLLAAIANKLPAADPVTPAEEGRPIDVVLCFDVSGSMEGLVGQAKAKMWDLVNDLAKVKPAPQLRVGLYSYGHNSYSPKDGRVRKDVDLTTDLDEVYKKMNSLTIYGGEEYVARVTRDALVQQKWSEDKGALKLIFVCGNEPVNQDREVQLADVAKLAKSKGVIINTIYCEWGHPEEAKGWEDYAIAAGGKFGKIDHNKRLIQINTPFDKEMAELNGKLNSTFVAYGRHGEEKKANQTEQDKNAVQAGAQSLNARVATKGTDLYRNSDWCLVSKCMEDPKFDITKVPVEDLPEEMKKMTPEQRVEFIKKKRAEREDLQKQISETNVKRQKYVDAEMKKHATASDKALETALREMIRTQAAGKGIQIPD